MWGQYCNQTINSLSCFLSDSYNSTENMVSCKNFETFCHGEGEVKVYLLEILGVAEQLTIMALNASLRTTVSNNTLKASGTNLTYYVRHGAMPSMALHDYSGDINKAPLVIHSPKVGRWFIAVVPGLSKEVSGSQNSSIQVCYSITWQVDQCPLGKAGLNCTSERYVLQVSFDECVLSVSCL